ncbi:hypothetical protein BBJ28_00022642 [Nothophytophthora sp. Chile5]|nr:hypothetical protein BBJ28_00022642 [Nothophytophthora sp. Chile5]
MPKVAKVASVEDAAKAVVEQQIEDSVLRTAEMFALTKRSAASAYEYGPRYMLQAGSLVGIRLIQPVAAAVGGSSETTSTGSATVTPANPVDVILGGHPVPPAPGVSIEGDDSAAEKASFVEQVAKEAEEDLALQKRKLYVVSPSLSLLAVTQLHIYVVGSCRLTYCLCTHSLASNGNSASAVVEYKKQVEKAAQFGTNSIVRRRATQVPKPKWHAPWKLKRVIAGHLGWVRSISVDPTNDWFVTGSADRTIKVWDLASGQLRLTLTGHINAIRGLEVSPRHPYLFSAGEDKKVLCWDLEYNKVIRSYHGHLSGVFSLKVHPTLDVLVTGGRDAVWDMRTKNQIHVLSGHQGTVWAMETQATDPQIITGSSDSTVKLWDLAAGKVMTTLTNHKKAVRAIAKSPTDHTFMSGAADNMKKWEAKEGRFLRNFSSHNAIINSISINQDGVMASCGDNGSMRFWDYPTGYCFQSDSTKAQPGSLDSEAGIFASTFDKTGLRFITCEADKTIKVWQEDSSASEDSHPIDMTQWTKDFTAPKRY